jgi:hypothetical protein
VRIKVIAPPKDPVVSSESFSDGGEVVPDRVR